MSNQTPQSGLMTALAVFLLVTALEAWGLHWVWNHVVTAAFGASEMLFGHMFVLVLAIRVFFRDIMRLGDIAEVLEEIKEIQYFMVRNDALKESKKPAVHDSDDK